MVTRVWLGGLIAVLGWVTSTLANEIEIRYQLEPLGGTTWKNTYTVKNLGLAEGIQLFTIWFDYETYENLAYSTPPLPPTGWDRKLWQPNKPLELDGAFDNLAEGPALTIGQSAGNFCITFDWVGPGQPQRQFFEIVDPDTWDTLASGYTVPEPGGLLLLLATGGSIWRRRIRRD